MPDEYRDKCVLRCQSLRFAYAIKFESQEHARMFCERARDHPIKFTRASTGTQHDLRIGFDEPYDIKKKGYILGLIWKQICACMRTDGR
eukprot:3570003-Pyramimonas_sp.AAC.1